MKKIYNQFYGGLAPYPGKLGTENQYAQGVDVDIHRKYGYIMPGWAYSNQFNSLPATTTPYKISGMPIDAVATYENSDQATGTYYQMIDHAGRWYHYSGTIDTSHAISGATIGQGITKGFIGASEYTFALYQSNIARYGAMTGSATLIDNWLTETTNMPAGGAVFNSAEVQHPYLWWKSYMWVGDGYKLAKFDGQTGVNGTWVAQSFALPIEWEITALFGTKNYIGICAYKPLVKNLALSSLGSTYNMESAIFFWDGTSSVYSYQMPIADNYIVNAYNKDGDIYLVTQGRSIGASLMITNENSIGAQKITSLKFDIDGVLQKFYMTGVENGSGYYTRCNKYNMDVFQNNLLLGVTGWSGTGRAQNYIFAYGAPDATQPISLYQPYSIVQSTGDNSINMGMVKQLSNGVIVAGSQQGGTFKYGSFSSGYSTSAKYKGMYTDLGQRAVINYIEVYFNPLVTGDSATITLEKDYETTAVTPQTDAGVISYAIDGTATHKRFDMGQTECHAFRPVIAWSAGGMAVSKIVIDYSFLDN